MKILIIMLSGAGDVLMATPLIKELRKKHPKAQIEALVMQNVLTKELLQHNKDINKIIYFNFSKEGPMKSIKFCLSLRKKYDLSITTYPQARYHYSIVTFLINAKKRIGFNYETQKPKLNKLFFNHTIDEEFPLHVVYHNLKILSCLNINMPKSPKQILNIDKQSKDYAKKYFKENKLKKTAILHAGSGLTKNFILKRWPIQNFAQLAKQLNKKKYQVLLIQGPEEKDINQEIINQSKLQKDKDIFIIETDILKAAAIIEKANLVISNDNVIGHIAAALNTKIISLFGPTSPENTAPFSQNKIIICKRPNHITPYRHGSKGIRQEQAKFMEKITVEDVMKYAS